MTTKTIFAGAALLLATVSVPALAAPRACLLSDISPAAMACSGFYAGNLLAGNPGAVDAQQDALATIGLAWDGDWNAVTKIGSLGGATTVDFSTADSNPIAKMYGTTWVAVHFGNSANLGGQATGFWKFDAGLAGLQTFLLNISRGSSGAVLYKTGLASPPPPVDGVVPEPASWAMMIAGFGLVGAAMRRRKAAIA